MAGDSEGILAAGLDHYLTKPLRKALIHEKIRRSCPPQAFKPLEADGIPPAHFCSRRRTLEQAPVRPLAHHAAAQAAVKPGKPRQDEASTFRQCRPRTCPA